MSGIPGTAAVPAALHDVPKSGRDGRGPRRKPTPIGCLMPDWFYRTISRAMLYRLPIRAARSFPLGFMGRLARLPLGGWVIDLLGHMRADPRLATTVLGVEFPAAVGLGSGSGPRGPASYSAKGLGSSGALADAAA